MEPDHSMISAKKREKQKRTAEKIIARLEARLQERRQLNSKSLSEKEIYVSKDDMDRLVANHAHDQQKWEQEKKDLQKDLQEYKYIAEKCYCQQNVDSKNEINSELDENLQKSENAKLKSLQNMLLSSKSSQNTCMVCDKQFVRRVDYLTHSALMHGIVLPEKEEDELSNRKQIIARLKTRPDNYKCKLQNDTEKCDDVKGKDVLSKWKILDAKSKTGTDSHKDQPLENSFKALKVVDSGMDQFMNQMHETSAKQRMEARQRLRRWIERMDEYKDEDCGEPKKMKKQQSTENATVSLSTQNPTMEVEKTANSLRDKLHITEPDHEVLPPKRKNFNLLSYLNAAVTYDERKEPPPQRVDVNSLRLKSLRQIEIEKAPGVVSSHYPSLFLTKQDYIPEVPPAELYVYDELDMQPTILSVVQNPYFTRQSRNLNSKNLERRSLEKAALDELKSNGIVTINFPNLHTSRQDDNSAFSSVEPSAKERPSQPKSFQEFIEELYQKPAQKQLKNNKNTINKHPLFPLIKMLFKKLELSTTCPSSERVVDLYSAKSFKEDVVVFCKQLRHDNPSFIANPEVDTLMIKAIEVLRVQLLEIEMVHELCESFCDKYMNCLNSKTIKGVMNDDGKEDDQPVEPTSSRSDAVLVWESMKRREFISALENHNCNTSECPVFVLRDLVKHASDCTVGGSQCESFICQLIHQKNRHFKNCCDKLRCPICVHLPVKDPEILDLMVIEKCCVKNRETSLLDIEKTINMVIRLAVNYGLVDNIEETSDVILNEFEDDDISDSEKSVESSSADSLSSSWSNMEEENDVSSSDDWELLEDDLENENLKE